MIGELEEQNQRERRLLKQRLYKEMLDNQILMNRRYKKEQSQKNHRSNGQTLVREIYCRPQQKGQMDDIMDESFIRRFNDSRDTVENVYLPTLQDRNMLYRGASRFIPLDDSFRLKTGHKRIKTELIHTDQLSYDDPIIQGLIEQLQNINKCTSKFHFKRGKRLNFIANQQKKITERSNYYIDNKSPNGANLFNKSMSTNQITNESQAKARVPKLFPSPLQKIGQLSQMTRKSDSQIKTDRIQKQLNQSTNFKIRQRVLSSRQTFLQVLRKVKKRGESLHLKFSKQFSEHNKNLQKVIV